MSEDRDLDWELRQLDAMAATVGKQMEKAEAYWVARKIGLATGRFPAIMRTVFEFAFKHHFDGMVRKLAAQDAKIDSLEKQVRESNERITNGAKLVAKQDKRIAALEAELKSLVTWAKGVRR